jgi:hypothetical protein
VLKHQDIVGDRAARCRLPDEDLPGDDVIGPGLVAREVEHIHLPAAACEVDGSEGQDDGRGEGRVNGKRGARGRGEVVWATVLGEAEQ